MSIQIECPLCGFRKEVAVTYGGKEVKCPHCETKFQVPLPQVTTLAVTGLFGKVKAKSPPENPASQKRERPEQPQRRTKSLMIAAGALLAIAAAGTAAYFVFFHGHEAEVAEATPPPSPLQPNVAPAPVDTASEEAHLAAEKKAADAKAARDKADAFAKKKEEERLAREEKERLRKEEEKRALEEKKERERLAQLAREEKERKEREAKEAHDAKFNPKLAATVEEVDSAPEKFYGKRLFFDNVRLKAGAIEKAKDMDLYTLGVTSKSGKYYSRVVIGSIFFSADNRLIADVQKEWNRFEEFPRVRLYCEIRPYEKKAGAKPVPQAHIFKFEVFTSGGTPVKSWEEPEEEPPAPKADGEKGAK